MRQPGLPIEFLQLKSRRSKPARTDYELGTLSKIICFFWWISGKYFVDRKPFPHTITKAFLHDGSMRTREIADIAFDIENGLLEAGPENLPLLIEAAARGHR